MLRLLNAVKPEIGAALNPIPGGLVRKEDANGNALIPSWWLRSEPSFRLTNGLQEGCVVVLDGWFRSQGEADAALRRLDEMRDFEALGAGVYTRQGEGVLHEEQNVHHAFVRWQVVAFAGAA